jgi:hypothetical protein
MIARKHRRRRRHGRQERTRAISLPRRIAICAVAAVGAILLWTTDAGADPVDMRNPATITLLSHPQEMVGIYDEVVITWEEPYFCHIDYGTEPGVFTNMTSASGTQSLSFRPADELMPPGIYYCIVHRASFPDHSEQFQLVIEAPIAPQPTSPPNGSVIHETTTTLGWDPVFGTPYYHVIVCDTEIAVEPDGSRISVKNLNIVWQAITSETSIQYGSIDPSGHFTDSNGTSPPLMEGLTYNWLVLNNYGNHPLMSSLAAVGMSGFTTDVQAAVQSPLQLAPADSAVVGGQFVDFTWASVDDAAGYHLYIYQLRDFGGRDAAFPIWDGASSTTERQVNLGSILTHGEHRWRVVALDSQGAGAPSDLRSFMYDADAAGTALIKTETSNGDVLPNVLIEIEYEAGGVTLPPSMTNDDGICERQLPPGNYLLTASKNYYVTEYAHVPINPGSDTSVLFRLPRAPAQISGTVVDEFGAPVFDAEIFGQSEAHADVNGFSDQNGNFLLSVTAGPWEVYAKKGGYIPSESQFVDAESYEHVQLPNPLVLTGEAGTVTGSVVNAAGSPVSGATVWAENAAESHAAATTANGHFSLELAPGQWTLWAEKSGFVPTDPREVDVPAGGHVEVTPSFVLSPVAATVSGRVTDGDVFFANALVHAVPPAGTVLTTTTDTYGEFVLTPPSGTYQMWAEVSGYRPANAQQVTVETGEIYTGLDLIVEARSCLIEGLVLAGGEPVEGAVVSDGDAQTTTDAAGAFSLQVAPGLHHLSTVKAGYSTGPPVLVATSPGQEISGIVITVAPGAGLISGAVLHNGAPVAHAFVTATNNAQQILTSADVAGNYALLLEGGDWAVAASKDGFGASEPVQVLLAAGQSATGVDLEVSAAWATVYGVVSGGRDALQRASVQLYREGENAPSYSTVTGMNGYYVINVAADEMYTLEARADGHGCRSIAIAAMNVEDEHAEYVSLTPYPGVIQGYIEDGSGNTVDDALVVASWGDSVWIRSGRTGRSGWFNLPVEAGTSSLRVVRPGYETETVSGISVAPDEVVDMTVELNQLFATIQGTVRDSVSGEALEGALVTARWEGGATSDVTGRSGWFDSGPVVPGLVDVRATLNGYKSGWASVEVGELENLLFDIDLVELTGAIAGSVTDPGGAGIEGASVRAKIGENVAATDVTDGDGLFFLSDLDDEQVYDIFVSKEGLYCVSDNPVTDVPTETLDVGFTMLAADGTIVGHVHDAQTGEPLAAAAVTADNGQGYFGEATSGPDGAFVLDGLAPMGTYEVSASLYGYFEKTALGVPVGGELIDLNLPRNFARIIGAVSLLGGDLAMEDVEAVATSTMYAGDSRSCVPDELGAYEIMDVRPGTYVLTISGDRCLGTPAQVSLVLGEGEVVMGQDFTVERAVLNRIEIEGSSMVMTGSESVFTGVAFAQGERLVDVDLEWWISPESAGSIGDRTGELRCKDGYIGELMIGARDAESGLTGRLETSVFALVAPETEETYFDSTGMTLVIEPGAVTESQVMFLAHEEVPDALAATEEFEVRGAAYHLKPDDLGFDPEHPAELMLPTSMADAMIARWSGDELEWELMNSWEAVNGVTVDLTALGKFVTATESEELGITDIAVQPNPFSPGSSDAVISYELSSTRSRMPFVTVKIYNMASQLVREIVVNEPQAKGRSQVLWDGLTDAGKAARNGRYVVRIEAEDASRTETANATIVLVK